MSLRAIRAPAGAFVRITCGLLVALLVACGGPGDRPVAARDPSPAVARARSRVPQRKPGLPTVVLIVLDTARADHLSLCGYGRPTTPYLDSLAVRRGPVVFTCDAYAPGSWTVPSHASFFTGLSVAEHGDDAIDRALPASVPTLAEAMRAKGYQTLLVSANPTLSTRSGLQRGFDAVRVAPGVSAWRGDKLTQELTRGLAALDPERPLFLVVNIFDAHDPFGAIPEGVPWAPPQPRITYDVHNELRDTVYHPFVRGTLPPDEAAALVRRVTDAYDVGLKEADANVERTIGALVEGGWTQTGFRVVVTSDHGEYLGEKQRLRHGCEADEALTRIPLLVYEPDRATPLVLPQPVSGRQVFWLLRDGTLAPDDVAVEAFSLGRPQDPRGCKDVAARWPAVGEKQVWRAGEMRAFDLRVDPGELGGAPLVGASAAALESRAKVYLAREAEAAKTVDGRRREEMRALGYVE